ncbi:hypothetical protein PN451_05270 [Dolichospermum planctonicum CS-1226]|uniref:Uncharacterized protein n=1 Tax=Dolichospermum planctonicum CS-1226 TaxID=3021751 RepID=A0ABT5AE86_9CYAN|nr:hypothetical protein [Dolichospermum planctonicum]MDB9535262.1 hypothetical protein [Dolichospermum planctonicum CS-1226]
MAVIDTFLCKDKKEVAMVCQQLMTNLDDRGISASQVAKVNRKDDTFRFIQVQSRLLHGISSSLTNHAGDDDDPIVPPS